MRALRALWVAGAFWSAGAEFGGPRAADFEVINTANAGYGSFRQALLDANDNPGADRVVFNLPGTGVRTIQILSPLPAVTETLDIDAYSQPGARPNSLSNGFNGVLLVQLDGVSRTQGGLALQGDSCVVRGLILNRFDVGIRLQSSSNVVAGNLIGVDPSGTAALGNNFGIATSGDAGNIVGGLHPADRNVIGGNNNGALQVGGLPGSAAISTNLMVLGNFLGTDATGLAVLPRSQTAPTVIVVGAEDFALGDAAPGAGNIIGVGGIGVNVFAAVARSRIVGNSIGVGADGRTPLFNTNAVTALNVQAGARIEQNTIAYAAVGVRVFGVGVAILGNRIYSNAFAGILHGNSIPANDFGDADGGPNQQQNHPVVTASFDDTQLHVEGALSSRTNTAYTIEIFAAGARGSNGYVQGEHPLGTLEVTTLANGTAAFSASYPYPGPDLPWITATATDPAGNTSVFAPAASARSRTRLFVHQHPVSQFVSNGVNVVFRGEMSGAAPITYQWLWNGAPLPGATNNVLVLSNVSPTQQGIYQLSALNPYGSLETHSAGLVVLAAPVFVEQPISQTVAPGEWVTISAAVSDLTTTPVGFRWRSNNIFVASTAGTQFHSFFTYRAGTSAVNLVVVATNAVARSGIVSSTARITVGADLDQDGLPDDYETRLGLNPANAEDATADADGDGVSNRAEYTAGTDPRNPLDHLRIDRLTTGASGTTLAFSVMSNRTYRVESTEMLHLNPPPWETLAIMPATTTNGPVMIRDRRSIDAGSRFYRLVTPASP